ncbi:MAG: putative rane protein mmpL3, partial [Dehalococcoidia bacterium]|nr:putative rane protein mmpL3 [Dehalococcoidia bacterium]
MYARFGDLVYQRRWAIIALWLIAVIASIPLASRVGLALKAGGFSHPGSEGAQAIALLHQELNFSRSSITLLFSSDSLRADDPSFVEEMERALAPLRSHPQVQEIITSESTGNPRFIAPDGHTTYVLVGLRVETAVAQRLLPELKALIGTTTLQVWLTGAPVAYTDLEVVSHRDLQRAERYSFPLALVALVLVFGSLV